MSDFSDYYENRIIDHMLRGQAFTPPAVIYLALFTASTGLETGSPTGEVSFSGTGYVRKAIALSAASGGNTANSAELLWDAATGNWGNVTHAAIVDHATNTGWGTNVNVLAWKNLNEAKTINTTDVFRVAAGSLTFAVQ